MSSIEASSSLPTTDLGWGVFSYPYHPLSGSELVDKLEELANPQRVGDTDCISLQASGVRSEDRSLVSKLDLPGGIWTLNAVMDGHGGHECADYVTASLHIKVEDLLKSALTEVIPHQLPNATVSDILTKAISSLDEAITRDILALFPGGVDSIASMTDEEIDAIVNDGGQNNAKFLRGMRGTTVLVSLVDPLSENLWVASLGDCQAVLSSKNSSGEWKGTLLSSNHNGAAQDEVDRVRSEHPGEEKAIMNDRVVNAIAVTRAIGDHQFKLPSIYATRIMARHKPGFAISKKLEEFMPYVITPPYVSNIADVRHVDLTAHDKVNRTLIMGSDGLHDVFIYDPARKDLTNIEEVTAHEARLVGEFNDADKSGGSAALYLLRDALGGDDDDKVSQYLTLDMGEKKKKWMDDITVLVQSL